MLALLEPARNLSLNVAAELVPIEGLAGNDPDPGHLFHDGVIGGGRGVRVHELGELAEECLRGHLLNLALRSRRRVDLRARRYVGRWRVRASPVAQWGELVARLNVIDGFERLRAVILRRAFDPHQVRRSFDQFHALGRLSAPVWTGNEEVAASGARGARPRRFEDVRPPRQDRHLVVDTARIGHREDERLLGQVKPGVGEQHVDGCRRNRDKRRRDRLGRLVELINRRRECLRRFHIRQLISRIFHRDEREAIDVCSLSDLLCLFPRWRSRRCRQGQAAYRLGVSIIDGAFNCRIDLLGIVTAAGEGDEKNHR